MCFDILSFVVGVPLRHLSTGVKLVSRFKFRIFFLVCKIFQIDKSLSYSNQFIKIVRIQYS